MPSSVFKMKRKTISLTIFQAKVNDQVINQQREFLILLWKAINLRTTLLLKKVNGLWKNSQYFKMTFQYGFPLF